MKDPAVWQFKNCSKYGKVTETVGNITYCSEVSEELNINREIVKLILTYNTNMKKSLSRNGTGKCLGQASNKKNLLRTW